MSDMAQKIGELKGKAEVKADEVKMKAGELKGKADGKVINQVVADLCK